MIFLAFRNLFQNKTRLMLSIGGVALALLLIFALDAIFTGVEGQITAYIRNSGADIYVSQAGVRNMHMASSALPATSITEVQKLKGVQSVIPILYLTNVVVIKDERNIAYIIGLPENAAAGGPWKVSSGRSMPERGEAIIDRQIAEKSGIGLGDPVEILGRKFIVAGLSEETSSLVNSIAFIPLEDFQNLRGSRDTVSFLLVKAAAGEDLTQLVNQIETNISGVTAQTRDSFADQEQQVVKDMSTDVINLMNLIGFLIGLAVMALTIYTATLSRRKEYGVLKALGAKNSHLYRAVLAQAGISIGLGGIIGLLFTLLLGYLLPLIRINLPLIVSWASLGKVASVSLAIGILSAILPIRQIANLDPVMIFRGK